MGSAPPNTPAASAEPRPVSEAVVRLRLVDLSSSARPLTPSSAPSAAASSPSPSASAHAPGPPNYWTP